MSDGVSFDELWDEHIHDRLFLRDYDGDHGESLVAYYVALEPGLKTAFRVGLESVVARRARGFEAAENYLKAIRQLDNPRSP